MFKIESYITPILLSYVDKYVRDFKPADAQVSLWGGGVALHNLVLKADVLQSEVALPFTLVSGRIHELLIQVPWTKIMSESIIITIDTIECVLSLNPPPQSDSAPPEPQRRNQVVEAPPGYMQALVRRIVSNIALRVHHLIVKYVQDDIVLSLNVKHLAVDSAGPNWEPAFADIEQAKPMLRRLVRLDDLTLCLDRADADGKIRFYQEPLLYRCQLDLRVLTRLVSASTRRASNLSVQLRSSKLAWGVSGDQLVLLLRLVRESPKVEVKPPPPPPKMSHVAPLHTTNTAEPARQESWSEWAWSWLPAWADREGGAEEMPSQPSPIPVHLTAFLDDVSLAFKVMELDGSMRKRGRGVLELSASHAAVKSSLRAPTMTRLCVGLRTITLSSRGKCVCGHLAFETLKEEPTIYLSKAEVAEEKEWSWPDENLTDSKIEVGQDADEALHAPPHMPAEFQSLTEQPEEEATVEVAASSTDELDPLWVAMEPVLFLEFCHERSPPMAYTNPYDNPPTDFEYSDWVEVCTAKVQLRPMTARLCTGLLHRLTALKTILAELPSLPVAELPMRTLTIEECDALLENLPQRRVTIDVQELRVRLVPFDHVANERASGEPPLTLDLDVPKAQFIVTGPLYPHRVCSAASQLPLESGSLWKGARLHVTGTVTAAQVQLRGHGHPKPCARTDLRFVVHSLLHQQMFSKKESVVHSYSLKICEASLCGSLARLQAAIQVANSLTNERASIALQHTTLATDALNDEESVAIELTLEELSVRGYLTKNINTHILSMQSARATAHHAPKGGEAKQAWLFAAPDDPSTTPYLRFAVQWCEHLMPNSLDYVGMWTEPISFCVDPLFIAWLAYRPNMKPSYESQSTKLPKSMSSHLIRRRTTPPSSSKFGSRSGSGAELVHIRPRSAGSSSEPSAEAGKKEPKNATAGAQSQSQTQWWCGDRATAIHNRLRHTLVSVELSLMLVYLWSGSASALGSETLRDAMERHREPVLQLSLGRVSMHSNTANKHLWQEIRHDGPTFIIPSSTISTEESFPWKLRLADVSCYTLQTRDITDHSSRERSASGLRSQLKMSGLSLPKTVLEMVTSTVTLSVVTKSMQIKIPARQEHKSTQSVPTNDKTKYFTAGLDFKPSTLKEFFRGPAKRKKSTVDSSDMPAASPAPPTPQMPQMVVTTGPMVSLGVHIHADTPPIVVRLDQEQVHLVAAAVHGLQHILTLLQRPQSYADSRQSFTSQGGSHRSLIRSVSEIEEIRTPSEETKSENQSQELISIFESRSVSEPVVDIKTFFWFQWVVSRATVVIATHSVKLAFDVDDIISTVDLQSHYNQLKVKIASASVRHYERVGSDEWVAGILGGRVLEAREPTNSMEDNHFMSVTITQAQISNLPASWKEEMHPKLIEDKSKVDTMWEIYATLAPLEVLVQPAVVENVKSLAREFAPRSFCPLQVVEEDRYEPWQWPSCYVTAGGVRLLLTSEDEERETGDDTFIFQTGKVTVNPHPENPICRRTVNAVEASWVGGGLVEGRQYEVLVQNCALRSAQLQQIVSQEVSEDLVKGTSGENPALKWTQPIVAPVITPMLHPVDISCVFAPAMFVNDALVSGHAAELNLVSDCSLEVSVYQLGLLQRVLRDLMRERPTMFFEEKCDVCPYATLLMEATDDLPSLYNESVLTDEPTRSTQMDVGPSVATDSGVDTVTSHSTKNSRLDDVTIKKSVSITFADNAAKPSEYLEVFVTMGVIDISMYVGDDGSPEVVALRLPDPNAAPPASAGATPNVQINVIFEESTQKTKAVIDDAISSGDSCTKSLTDTTRTHDVHKSRIGLRNLARASLCEGNVPLLHITLHQPNLYYWRRRAQKSFQVSLFNAWVGLGNGQIEGRWNAPLISTTKGVPDPVSDIPPALATMKLTTPAGGNARGLLRLDVERPVQLEVCTDRLHRLKEIAALIKSHLMQNESNLSLQKPMEVELPFLYRLRQFLVVQSLESMTVQTSQLSVCGSEGTVGCDSLSAQVTAGGRPERPERLKARVLLMALLVAAGPPGDRRHLLLQPTTLGADLEAVWDAWRRAEGGAVACEPTVELCLDLDRLIVEIRPCELAALNRLNKALATDPLATDHRPKHMHHDTGVKSPTQNISSNTSLEAERSDHYYKDDLRSGAFKLVSGGQLPMAYQVTVHGQSVAWRYPHPRAITRIVAFPLPDQDKEIECVLEFYCPLLGNWHSYSFFNIPLGSPTEMQLYIKPPDAVFAQMWRFRPCSEKETRPLPFEFDITRYTPRTDPQLFEVQPDMDSPRTEAPVSAEQLSGVVRVDSYFAPRALPLTRFAVRLAAFELHLHNSLPALFSRAKVLEGYYVSKPLMRSHRVLSVNARDASMYGHLGAPAGYKVMLAASIASDIVECATGTMELLVEEFRLQLALSVPEGEAEQARVRGCATAVRLSLHVPRLRTVRALVADWQAAAQQYLRPSEDSSLEEDQPSPHMTTNRELWAITATALEGRVSLWLHNSCASALRVGQEGTDELVPLGPGARLAYRWRSPIAQKKLRVALAGPTTDWHWSTSVPFMAGSYRVRLEDAEALGSKSSPGGGVYAHIRVNARGAQRTMHLAGRLALANMLRYNLLYKVRARCAESVQWHTVCSGELESEGVGRSVVCGADCEMALKIKFETRDTGWSGDIPLKECPKENVPWLVKVPSEGVVPYISVWCRVVRARSDGRVLATVWPLYVLYSHLPLDTDVLITTESSNSPGEGTSEEQPPLLVQTAAGRGTTTHLIAPGTTAVRHSLSFQYKNMDCPVTREEVPLHYGVTDTSVFDKRAPVNTLEEVMKDILDWLKRSGRNAKSSWPYSVVAAHWPGEWEPAMLQPRCDVTVRYQAVRAGGGCCLELQLCPIALMCNATPIALTLRAHDAAPLCKLEPGTAISPPSVVLEKPFFISLEVGRETFVSGQLVVSSAEPGRYGTPAPGHLALDHPAPFAIQCNHKVALLTMYYEIKQEINVLGASTTYELINMLDTDVLVSAIAVPNEPATNVPLQPKTFKVVEPSKEMTVYGTPLCRFWLSNRWRGSDPSELTAYLCVALPSPEYPAAPVPVRLGCPPYRRSFALVNSDDTSVPVVITQMKHDGRWLVTVARDPCPQFLVYNRTGKQLTVAQPLNAPIEPSVFTVAEKECPGANWWLVVNAGKTIHYSSPQHCARYPPPPRPPDTMQLLTFAFPSMDDSDPLWCPPVAINDGEQLVQLHGGTTLKLRVRTNPHSTLLELKDVAQTDISASDIRKRLLEPYILKEKLQLRKKSKSLASSAHNLQRTHGDQNILEKSIVIDDPGEELLDAYEEKEIDVMPDRVGQSELNLAVAFQGNPRTMSDDRRSVTSNRSRTHSDNRKASKIDERQPDNAADRPSNSLDAADRQPTAPDAADRQPDSSDVADRQPDSSVAADRQPGSSGAVDRQLGSSDAADRQPESSGAVDRQPGLSDAADRQPDSSGAAVRQPGSSDAADRQPDSSDAADWQPDSSDAADRQPDSSDAADRQPDSSDAADRQSVSMQVIKEVSATPFLGMEIDEDADQSDASCKYSKFDSQASFIFQEVAPPEWQECSAPWPESERVRFIAASLSLELGASAEAPPLLALHLDRVALLLTTDVKGTKTSLSIAGVQIDNLQYDSGQYDFAVVASTAVVPRELDRWPSVWNMLVEHATFGMREEEATVLLHLRRDWWTLLDQTFSEITEVELSVSPLALYVEDAYVTALVELARLALPATPQDEAAPVLAEMRTLQRPLRLHSLLVHPLQLTLTLHTAVRMYIALDQSPLRLGAFQLKDVMTSVERLTHALTVHYLSAAILGAGWVVGGLELLGAPGALAARVGGAGGGVRGVAAAAAAALVRSLAACAGSLARNLDLLAGDEEHARRAAAARRSNPPSLAAGLLAGITNFAINILGAVGGLAHHPLVGVAVGETESGAAALRRGLVGALTKPLSATADLVAFAGRGLLTQTGWDPVPQPRESRWLARHCDCAPLCASGWRQDCVRWAFRLAEVSTLVGFEVLLNNVPLNLLLTHKLLVVAEPESERIVEMIDLRFCTLAPYEGQVIVLCVTQRRMSRSTDTRNIDEDDEYQISAAAMARVARYTGAEGASAGVGGGGGACGSDARTLSLLPGPGRALALHAALAAAVHHNCDTHFSLL